MKTVFLQSIAWAAVACGHLMLGQSLRFSSGATDINGNVSLNLNGPTNRWIHIQRLGYANQTWSTVSTNWIGSSGALSVTLTNGLSSGVYGVFRAQTSNSSHWTTNGYGAVVGTLGQYNTLIGNPFAGSYVSTVIPQPPDGLQVHLYRNGTYSTSEYLGGFWLNDQDVGLCEGMLVYNPSTNAVKYVVDGVFATNSVAVSVESPLALIASPIFRISQSHTNGVPLSQRVDLLQTNLVAGASALPVTGACTTNIVFDLFRLSGASGPQYTEFNLLCGGTSWSTGSTNAAWTSVPLHLTEGFWIALPTNRTWNLPARSIH